MRIGNKISPQLRRLEQLDAKSAPKASAKAPAKSAPKAVAKTPPATQPRSNVAPHTALPAPEGKFKAWVYWNFPSVYHFFNRAFGPKLPPAPPTVQHHGVVIETNGVSPVAVQEAKEALNLIAVKPEYAEAFKQNKVHFVIIPKGKDLTSLEAFADLKGQKTFDGRTWDDVRGVAGHMVNGTYYVAAGEENLAELTGDGYPGNYSTALHELAHVLHHNGLDWEVLRDLQGAYSDRSEKNGPWINDYSSKSEYEYFAEGTSAYFGRERGMGKNAAWLKANDPALYTVLQQVYGTPPKY